MPNLKNNCIDVTPARVINEIRANGEIILSEQPRFRRLLHERSTLGFILEEMQGGYRNSLQEQFLQELALHNTYKWDNGTTLRVKFVDDIEHFADQIMQYASEWSNYCSINFERSNDFDSEIRISSTRSGSWSFIGNYCQQVPRTRSTMNYGWFDDTTPDFEIRRTVLHEFGHALGCIHEHQSPDAGIAWNREEIYRRFSLPPNNWDQAKVDTNIFTRYSAEEISNSKFDRSSIMLYPIERWQTTNGFFVAWNNELSDTDKSFIAEMYPI